MTVTRIRSAARVAALVALVPGVLSAGPIEVDEGLAPYDTASGTYGYFKKNALCKGDYKDTVKEQPGSASVVQGVAEDLSSIGYSGVGYRTSGVKILSLAGKAGGALIDTDPAAVLSGKYPLSRFLYLYINKVPNRDLDPLVREFVTYVLSRAGQEVVVKDGYLPISATIADVERAKLNGGS